MSWFGSPFEGDLKNGRVEGNGKFTFANGNVYIGEFKDGEFHGEGTIHFKTGGTFKAKWNKGVMQEGTFTFSDGLVYADKWDYCTAAGDNPDRRFYIERINGFQPGTERITNDPNGPQYIPRGTFDVMDGYYDPKDEKVYEYSGKKVLRTPDREEKEWIVRCCRVGE